jgi:hypothetical protein
MQGKYVLFLKNNRFVDLYAVCGGLCESDTIFV